MTGSTRGQLRECYCEVDQEDEKRKSIVQQILQKNTDLLRRIIIPVEGQGGVMLSSEYPHCQRYPHDDNIWRVSPGHGDVNNEEEAVQLVARGVQRPARLEESEQGLDHTGQHRPPRSKDLPSHVPPHGVRDNLINALKLLANQQLGGGSLVEVLVVTKNKAS